MNRQSFVENLIYLTLTYVQCCLWGALSFAAPQANPPLNSMEVSTPSTDLTGDARIESLNISSEQERKQKSPSLTWADSLHNRLSLSTNIFTGPYQDQKTHTLALLGLDFSLPIDPSEKWHLGALVGASPNPFLLVSHESYLRNYWTYLKSWSFRVLLEADSRQQLSAFLNSNNFCGGAGLTFVVAERLDLNVDAYPLSSRGPALLLGLAYQLP